MSRSISQISIRVFFGLLGIGLTTGLAHAEKADHDKPTNIVFSQAAIDDLKQTQLFSGAVVLTKGTILIRADQLAVRQDPEGYSYSTSTMNQPGKLAYFKQKREGLDEEVQGEADRIDYNEKTDIVTFTGHATVRRLSGTKVMDEAHGNVIEYHNQQESYTVVGNERGPTNSANGSTPPVETRGHITLQPKNKTAESAPAPAASGLDLKTAPDLKIKPD